MGFWSKNCMHPECGHPALCVDATNDVNRWMSQVVSIGRRGEIHIGEYDGYGRVGSADDALSNDVTLYHVACWELLGKPLTFAGAADHADDQGWFFDDGDHTRVDPRSERDRLDYAAGSFPKRAAQVAEAARPGSTSVAADGGRATRSHKIRVEVESHGVWRDVSDQLVGQAAVSWIATVLGWANQGQHVRIDVEPGS